MWDKYSNFVLSKSNQMEKIVNDYQTFLETSTTEETPETPENQIETEKDPKDIKLFYTLETNRIEVPVGTDVISKTGNKKSTFDKIIKKITRISKFIKIPVPVLKPIETKKYYSLVHFGQNGFSYYHGKFSNDKNFTDNFSEVEKIKNSLNVSDKWQLTSKDVEVYDLTMATVIKPEDEWIILGTIDYKDNLLKAAPGQQVPIELVGDMSGNSDCDHCHKRIYRNKIVFIKKIKDGSIIKVGGTCIKNYLGYDYEKVLTYLTDISFLGESWGDNGGGDDWEFGGEGGYGSFVETYISVNEIVKYYIWWYNNRGYISRASAEKINSKKREEWLKNNPSSDPEDYYYSDKSGSKQSTGDSVRDDVDYAYSPPENSGKYEQENMEQWQEFVSEYDSRLKTISDDNPYIQKFYDFIEENRGDNNFLFNVSNMIKGNTVKKHLINYITGGCSFYFGRLYAEEMKRKAEEEKLNAEKKVEVKPSEWVGVVGEKTKIENLEIVHIGGFETQWGWSNVYKLKDQEGNVYTKFGTISPKYIVKKREISTENVEGEDGVVFAETPSNDIEVGDFISVTAEIKKHDEYQGKKQTVLGRLSKL